tara:strand:+ start:15755 stop:19213 length:3459 start_codon:yes stop_codon:yes gene_type:complete
MSRNIRVRTEPNGGDNSVKIQLNQDFDFLEILSLKISQEDVYRSFYSDYGVVVGRVIVNSGVGVPNARISVFIPLTDEDAQDPEISTLYPYSDLQVLTDDGIRYNTLPKDAQGECHAPIGTFPTKRELIDNPKLFEVYEKYYKYTTTTNGAGDFMLFGVPVGNHVLNVDVDLSDIGIFSQRPYDFIEQGNPKKLFDSPTKFKAGNNLNNLTQVKNRQVGINVIPFWGEQEDKEVGISRVDVDLNYNLQPQAIFTGSIFGDNEKNSVNKNCRPRKKMGRVCEMGEGEGTIEIIRKTLFGDVEKIDIEGGQLINDNGVWAFQLPMNLDYMITNEFGRLIPTDDPSKGIPTRTRARFKISLNETGGSGRLRTKAKYLVPHNPERVSDIDYSFDESTPDIHFRDMYWNKIYTVKNHIARYQKNDNKQNRNFIGFKDVDDCVGVKNPIPFNKLDTDFNPLYTILCLIISFIIEIIAILNNIISFEIRVGPFRIRPFCFIGCLPITCPINQTVYFPGCRSGRCGSSGNVNKDEAIDCFQIALAETLNVFEFDFYNDWINGALYPFLLKYKKNKSDEKFCGEGGGEDSNGLTNNNLVNTNPNGGRVSDSQSIEIDEGVIVSYEDELFYKPLTTGRGNGVGGAKLYATDLYNLGSVFNCDWQGLPKIQQELIATTYQIPPFVNERDEVGEITVTGLVPLLFEISCTNISVNNTQSQSIRRLCEIGVGLDEDETRNTAIDNADIDSELIRRQLIKLNDPNYTFDDLDDITATFTSSEYTTYRGENNVGGLSQFKNSFYFYFGTKPNNSALDLMNNKYFTSCSRLRKNIMNITGVVSDVTTVNGTDGSINITVQGGALDYTYQWYDKNNPLILLSDTEDVNNLPAGNYFVIVTDNNGASVKKTFIIRGLLELSTNITSRNTSSSIANNGIIFINSITGGIGPYDVTITGPSTDSQIDVPYATRFEGLDDGTYTVTITDSNVVEPQIYVNSIVIGVPTALSVEAISTPTNCVEFNDGKIRLNIEGGTPFYSIQFSSVTTNSTFSSDATYVNGQSAFVIFDDLQPGVYTFLVTDEFDQVFPLGGIPQEVIVEDTPEPTISRLFTSLLLGNLVEEVQYTLQLGGSDVQTGIIGPASGTLTLSGYPSDSNRYQIISQFGCASNTVE